MGKAAARSRRERNLGWLETLRRLCAAPPPPPLPQQPPPITQLSSSLFPSRSESTLLSSFFFSDTLLDIACGISREWEQGARVWVLSIYSI